MEIRKENGNYTVNGINLEDLVSNRKHIINYVSFKIRECERLLEDKHYNETTRLTFKTRLKVLQEIQNELKFKTK